MAIMKGITKFLALALAAGSLFTLAACSSASQKTGTSANWDERVVTNDLQDNSEWFTSKEVATYSVKFTEGSNSTYSLNYVTDGSKTAEYKTEFYAIKYDWNSTDIPESFRASETTVENVYVYKTYLTISGSYKYKNSGEVKEFDDSIQTISYFRSAKNNLQPVYTKQIIKSTSPATYAATSLASTYVEMDAVYETFYNKSCNSAIIKTTDNTSTTEVADKQVSLTGTYSLFDTAYLPLALRSLTLSSGSTHTFDVMIPINGTTSVYQASGSSSAKLDATYDDDKQIIDALNSSTPTTYVFANTDSEGNTYYECNSATLSLVDSMSGPSYTYYYATVPNNSFNAARAVLLKMNTPIYFGLGTLTYVLSSLNQQAI
jgi:hypothetical protein